MIAGYRRLFLSRNTLMTGFVAAAVLLPAGMLLRFFFGTLTIFHAVNGLLCLAMLLGLRKAYDRDDLIRMNGLISGILMLELGRYAYLAEQLLSVGRSEIISLGFYSCMSLSGYLMICFILMMLTYNHFHIDLRRPGGRSRVIVNQLSLVILLICFAGVTVTGMLTDGDLPWHLTEAASFLADLALFVDISCCELTLAIDSMLA